MIKSLTYYLSIITKISIIEKAGEYGCLPYLPTGTMMNPRDLFSNLCRSYLEKKIAEKMVNICRLNVIIWHQSVEEEYETSESRELYPAGKWCFCTNLKRRGRSGGMNIENNPWRKIGKLCFFTNFQEDMHIMYPGNWT